MTMLSLTRLSGADHHRGHREQSLQDVRGEDTNTCPDTDSSTHKYLAPDMPIVVAQITRVRGLTALLNGPCPSKTAALKR